MSVQATARVTCRTLTTHSATHRVYHKHPGIVLDALLKTRKLQRIVKLKDGQRHQPSAGGLFDSLCDLQLVRARLEEQDAVSAQDDCSM